MTPTSEMDEGRTAKQTERPRHSCQTHRVASLAAAGASASPPTGDMFPAENDWGGTG